MTRSMLISGLLILLWGCRAPGQEDLGQCAGNHPMDSLAIWQQRALPLVERPEIVGIGLHPVRKCLAIGVADSIDLSGAEAELRELGIPRDAMVITVGDEPE